jgi:hypothetical protein
MFRLTVRTTNPIVTEAIAGLLRPYLEQGIMFEPVIPTP